MHNIRTIAIIYDNTSHPMTTGEYCRRALEKICTVKHLLPGELDSIKPGEFDLYLNIDDSLRYILPVYLKPSAWWVIDTHLQYEWDLDKAGLFDIVFAAQKDGAERLSDDGVRNVFWLPLACDPEIHKKYPCEKMYDWCFIGATEPRDRFKERTDIIQLLQGRFSNSFTGKAFKDDMAKIFSSSRIVFNRSIKNDINMRVFEALSTGSLLVTNNLDENGMAELLEDGKDYISYRNNEELPDKISYYLNNPVERETIASRGMEKVRKYHTYDERMNTLLIRTSEVLSRRYRSKAFKYYHADRPELFDSVPKNVKRVLEIGCGAGILGGTIRQEYGAYVTGIELVPEVAAEARKRIDRVIEGNCEDLDLSSMLGDERFDCLILGDVLEHMREPLAFLKNIRRLLTENASVVASIPNVQNLSIISSLVNGHWEYTDLGILDKTHLRFFTRLEIQKLLTNAGFTITGINEKYDSTYHKWINSGKPGQFNVGPLSIGPLPENSIKDFFVYQYIVTAISRERKTSIVILTYNGLDLVRLCIDSVIKHTDEPYELIVVDNGSKDGVLKYLNEIKNILGDRITIIRNDENKGFPYGCNQGIKAAKGDYICLLNSDTMVSDGWLSGMIRVAAADRAIGIVGPLTNNTLPGEQMIPRTYSDTEGLSAFAKDLREKNRGKFTVLEDSAILTGFCMLIKSEVVNIIGLLDVDFGLGTFEDNDYCWRARVAGYKLAVAQDVFIHHRLMGSFDANRIDIDKMSRQNLNYFNNKKAINGYREVEVKLDKKENTYHDGNTSISSIALRTLSDGQRRTYCFNINYTSSSGPGVIELMFKDAGRNNFNEIMEKELYSALNGRVKSSDMKMFNLCKKAVIDVMELKLVKFPVPEKVTFFMNPK